MPAGPRFSAKALLGCGFLLAALTTTGVLFSRVEGAPTLPRRLSHHITGSMEQLVVVLPTRPTLYATDPVYTVEVTALALQGRVLSIEGESPCRVTISIDPSLRRRLGQASEVIAMAPGYDLGWVLKTLVPPDLRQYVLAEVDKLWSMHGAETIEQIKGPGLAALADILATLADEFPRALAAEKASFDAFTEAFSREIFPIHLEPALKDIVLARVQSKLGPALGDLGTAIWSNISITDILAIFWTASQESIGLVAREEQAARLTKVLEARAVPVLREKAPGVLRSFGEALGESLADPRVVTALHKTAQEISAHPAFVTFLEKLLGRWIGNNPVVGAQVQAAFANSSLTAPLTEFYKLAEPLLQEALNEMLTRPDRLGMDHQLVRVLRHVVLLKDDRYLLVVPQGSVPRTPITELVGRLGVDP